MEAFVDQSPSLSGEEIQVKLQKSLLKLPDKQRLVFHLKYEEDLSYEEIAQITGTSVSVRLIRHDQTSIRPSCTRSFNGRRNFAGDADAVEGRAKRSDLGRGEARDQTQPAETCEATVEPALQRQIQMRRQRRLPAAPATAAAISR